MGTPATRIAAQRATLSFLFSGSEDLEANSSQSTVGGLSKNDLDPTSVCSDGGVGLEGGEDEGGKDGPDSRGIRDELDLQD